ncbi:hypothetical protein ACFQ0M_48305 [Kitasatospora aburaviensis]|uniref:Uncharacterized protein n=1 Tax=Kitasatospora aburaviensis TaxID=67265 RepID=A0ABW1EYQ2_9ACTN
MDSTLIRAAWDAAQLDQRPNGSAFTHLVIPPNLAETGWSLLRAELAGPHGRLPINLDARPSTHTDDIEQSIARYEAAQRLRAALDHYDLDPWANGLCIPLTRPGTPVSMAKTPRAFIALYRIVSGGERRIVDAIPQPANWDAFADYRQRCQEQRLTALWVDAVDRYDAQKAAAEFLEQSFR